jgi:hypothetical protein
MFGTLSDFDHLLHKAKDLGKWCNDRPQCIDYRTREVNEVSQKLMLILHSWNEYPFLKLFAMPQIPRSVAETFSELNMGAWCHAADYRRFYNFFTKRSNGQSCQNVLKLYLHTNSWNWTGSMNDSYF